MHVHTWVCSHSSSPTHAAVVLIKQASPHIHSIPHLQYAIGEMEDDGTSCPEPSSEVWQSHTLVNGSLTCTQQSVHTHTYNNEYWSRAVAVWPMHIHVVCSVHLHVNVHFTKTLYHFSYNTLTCTYCGLITPKG